MRLLRAKKPQCSIHDAARHNRLNDVRYLVEQQGVDKDALDTKLCTPLHHACLNGAAKVADYLVEQNADVNARDEDGLTPLHCAVMSGKALAVKFLLIRTNPDLDQQDLLGRTPLHLAVSSGLQEAAELLLTRGASPNIPDRAGLTPLHQAVKLVARKMVKLLVEHQADAALRDMKGKTPRDYASSDTMGNLLGSSGSQVAKDQGSRSRRRSIADSEASCSDVASTSSASSRLPPSGWTPFASGESDPSSSYKTAEQRHHQQQHQRQQQRQLATPRLSAQRQWVVPAVATAAATGVAAGLVATEAVAGGLTASTIQAAGLATSAALAGARVGLDPVGGAGAVLALAAVVTQLAIKALYNQEQVKMLRRRMDNLTPIMQAFLDLSSRNQGLDLPASVQAALAHCFQNVYETMFNCKTILEGWQKMGRDALGIVKRFLGASFYEMELGDMQENLTNAMVDLTAVMTSIEAYSSSSRAVSTGDVGPTALQMQQAAAADRMAFESYLIQAVGGIAALQQQIQSREAEWSEAHAQLQQHGVQMREVHRLLEEVVEGVRKLQVSTGSLNDRMDIHEALVKQLRDSNQEIDLKVERIIQYVQALMSQQSSREAVPSEALEEGQSSPAAAKLRLCAPTCVVHRDTIDVVLVKENIIGQGASGTIFRGRYGTTPVAIKRFELSGVNTNGMRQVYMEAIILGQLSHPNIVTLYGMVVDPGTGCQGSSSSSSITSTSSMGSAKQGRGPGPAVIGRTAGAGAAGGVTTGFQQVDLHGALVMELMETDLAAYLEEYKELSMKNRVALAAHIAFGLHYLHNLSGSHAPIVHGDMKPRNVLVNKKPLQVKLCDFGLSRTSSLSRTRTSLFRSAGGSQLWLAPEIWSAITSGQPLRKTPASDVYAFGLVMYEILTGFQPFYEGSVDLLHMQVPAGLQPGFEDWRYKEEDFSQQLIVLMRRCWQRDPGARPNMCEVYEELQQLIGLLQE